MAAPPRLKQVEAGNVSWDIVDVELDAISCVRRPAGDDRRLHAARWCRWHPGGQDFIEGTLHDCAVANIVYSTIFVDSSNGGRPEDHGRLLRPREVPGQARPAKAEANLEFALIADGVPAKDVYDVLNTPAGIDRAFAKLDTIKGSVVWWEAGAQPPQLLADGEVVMTTAYNGRIFNAVAGEDKPFEIVWVSQIWDIDLGHPEGREQGPGARLPEVLHRHQAAGGSGVLHPRPGA